MYTAQEDGDRGFRIGSAGIMQQSPQSGSFKPECGLMHCFLWIYQFS